jgi:hypothetical protein
MKQVMIDIEVGESEMEYIQGRMCDLEAFTPGDMG